MYWNTASHFLTVVHYYATYFIGSIQRVVLAQIAIYLSIYYTFIGDFADILGISVVILIYRHYVRANAAYLFQSVVYKFKVMMPDTTWRLVGCVEA